MEVGRGGCLTRCPERTTSTAWRPARCGVSGRVRAPCQLIHEEVGKCTGLVGTLNGAVNRHLAACGALGARIDQWPRAARWPREHPGRVRFYNTDSASLRAIRIRIGVSQ